MSDAGKLPYRPIREVEQQRIRNHAKWGDLSGCGNSPPPCNASGATILEDIRAALAAATPGPLVAFRANPRTDDPDRREWIGVTRDIATDYDPDVFSSRNCPPVDAELYANAPTWLAELLAEVDRLTSAVHMYADKLAEHECEAAAVAELGVALEETSNNAADYFDRALAAEQAVELVRELHPPTMDETAAVEWCYTCLLPYPCTTISALDGGEQHG